MLNQSYGPGKERALQAYRLSRVETASPAQLVLMLYNACLKSMRNALVCIPERNYSGANSALIKAQDILDELRGALNHDTGGLAGELDSVYDFVYTLLVKGNLEKDTHAIEGAIKVMAQIRDGWEEAVKNYG